MEFVQTDIPGVVLIKPDVFGDDRGFFTEIYRASIFGEHGFPTFVQDNMSKSQKGTIRGLHYQMGRPQAKLVMVPYGKVIDVAVDIRKGSPTFGKHVTVELSDENKYLLYIPVGFAHGFQVLSDEALFQYKCSNYYYPEGERGVNWQDTDLRIRWDTNVNPIVSSKDQNLPELNDVMTSDLPLYQPK
jgi:dTDP-4-dehydrorhamnose 3,5-epimerase